MDISSGCYTINWDTETSAGTGDGVQGKGDAKVPYKADVQVGVTDQEPEKPERKMRTDGLTFGVDETPPFHIALVYAFQIIFTNLSGSVTAVFVLHKILCGGRDYAFMAQLMSSTIFVSGLASFLQVTIGARIPVTQGSSFIFFPPIIALMNTDTWRCPDTNTLSPLNGTLNVTVEEEDLQHLWRPRLLMVSGSLMLASLVEVILGLTGIIGILMNFIGPLTLAPTIMLISIQLFPLANTSSVHHWGVAFLTVFLVLLFSVILCNVQVPVLNWSRRRGFHIARFPLFRMFSSLLAIGISWVLCYILTVTNHLPNDENSVGFLARTDSKLDSVTKSKWFILPYPGQFGLPGLDVGLFAGILAATLSSIIESIGDYHATAKICRIKTVPKHALNRAIGMEGFASVLSALIGTCHGTTSYSNVIGFIAYTGVASRRLWVMMSIILMLFGIFGKFGGAMASIPEPIIGGMIIVGLGFVFTVGISQLGKVDLMLVRNQITLGIALMLGMMFPKFLDENPNVIQTGSQDFDIVIGVFLSTGPFVGGLVGLILDNILPGSKEARGMEEEEEIDCNHEELEKEIRVFDLPFCTDPLRRFKIFSFIPFLPCYKERPCPCSCCPPCGKNKYKVKQTKAANRYVDNGNTLPSEKEQAQSNASLQAVNVTTI